MRACGAVPHLGSTVIDDDGVLIGIITNRDLRFENGLQPACFGGHDPMPLVTARVGVDKIDALALLARNKIEKLPAGR